MRGIITIGQPYPFFLVGYFGVPPICRGSFRPDSNSIAAKRICFQFLRKIEGYFRIGPLLALSVIEVGPWKRSASYMSNSADATEVQIWL
jgi:hypothetical protein